jgi:uncharacterized protein (UPF0335 family)
MTQPEPPHRHNGGPLSDEDARRLWNHVRALENLEEQKADLNLDIKARKELAKADGFDTNIVGIILKRRKAGAGETFAADTLLKLYEEALEEQGVLPLEKTRIAQPQRRSTEQIAQDLHGEEAPPMVRLSEQGEDKHGVH